ncbi:MAG: hypothetical protein J7484_01740 [Microbacterium sp.]|nr:hypothetical protein [Microbacterium sp.]
MYSPKGRWVGELQGQPGVIRDRGNKITELGGQMETSAKFLRTLAGDASGMKGKAVEKLQEVVGDTYEELDRAAKLYKPTGPILVDYANALDEFQPRIKARVADCEDAKSAFDGAPGYPEGGRPIWAQPAPWRSDDEKKTMDEDNATEDREKQRLQEEYQDALKAFDTDVDSWEHIFDQTADRIEDAYDGKIEDGFWDNVDGAVAVLVTVLQVVGAIVAIAAIIIGGPIIAAIGAVIAVATLALVAYQFLRGDANGWDLALAVVGIIPFGSVGKLFQGKSGALAFLGDAFKAFKPSTWSAASGQLHNIAMASRFAGGGASGFLQGGRTFWQLNNPAGIGDIMSRLAFGKDTTSLTNLVETMTGGSRGWANSTTLPAAWEFTHMIIGAPIKLTDKIANWTGNGDKSISKQVPWLGKLL